MKPEWKKLLVLNLPYLLFVYLFAKCGQAYRLAAGADASAKLLQLTGGISAALANPLPSLHPFDLCVGVAGAVAVRLIVYSKGKNAKKYRKGEEYGSARWGTAKDIAPYIDPKFENNILLTQTERLTMTGRPKDPKTARNKNVLVIGGSGSGKTRFYVKPNLMQCFPTSDYPTSFVVTDPNGNWIRNIVFAFPVPYNGKEIREFPLESQSTVEAVLLLTKLNVERHIEVDVSMDELDVTAAESKATYYEIREHVWEHHQLRVSNLYIAQVKQKYGIIERENYNKAKNENAKQPQCPKEKENVIVEALKHFQMI